MANVVRTPFRKWSGVSHLSGLEGRIPPSRRGAVVLTTAGSLGDLYPVLSIARSLDRIGVEVRLLLSPDDCVIARSWGLLATPVGPTRAQVAADLGVSFDRLANDFFHIPMPFLRRVVFPAIPDTLPQIEEACIGAACVAGTVMTFTAAIAAERAGLPFVPLTLQPTLAFSALDPPRGPGMDLAVRTPRNPVTRGWNRAVMGTARSVLRAGLSPSLNRVRARLDLPPHHGTPMVDPGMEAVPIRLGLWSESFAPVPDDAPPGLIAVGFPRAPLGDLSASVQAWLEAGPPPLVVTLGSIAQGIGGPAFWDEAVRLSRALGLRSVLLHGQAEVPDGLDILSLPHTPHAPLFPQAAAILHHGGMGTAAEALRSGRPQLVVPIGGDQPDNAARLTRMGVAVTLPRRQFSASRAMPKLRELLERFDYAHATDLGERIAHEDGALLAAMHLAQIASAD